MMHSALVVWGVGSHGVHGICLVFVGWVEMVYLWWGHAHGENLVESGCVTEVHVTVVRLQPSVWFVFQVLVVCRLCVPGMWGQLSVGSQPVECCPLVAAL